MQRDTFQVLDININENALIPISPAENSFNDWFFFMPPKLFVAKHALKHMMNQDFIFFIVDDSRASANQ